MAQHETSSHTASSHTEVAAEHAAVVHHEAFYLEPTFWVAVAFVIFMALALKPLVKVITKALDAKSRQVAAELTEARRLREEAQEVLASFQKKQRESLQEAEAMLATTRADAARITEKAETELKLAMEKRLKMATDKIARAEQKAVQDVEGYVAEIALKAAEKLIVEHVEKGGNDDLVKAAAASLSGKIH